MLGLLPLASGSTAAAGIVVGDDPHQRELCGGLSGGCSRSF